MADEPGGWELRRSLDKQAEDIRDGFAQLNARLDKLVSAETHSSDLRRVDDRLADLASDIAAEQSARVAALADERTARQEGDKAQQATLDRLTANIRWVAAAIVLPIALFIATLVMNTKGGA